MSQSYAKSPAAERKFTTREMVLVGMFAAVLAVISQISLPMPTGVPITIQVFGVALVGAVLGSRLGTTATLVYVLLGAIGLPIFANFSGGISSIVGVTGGYIWAWPIMTWLCGIREYPIEAPPPDPMKREIISEVLPLGVKAVDGLITIGKGQRIGIFAGSGQIQATTYIAWNTTSHAGFL